MTAWNFAELARRKYFNNTSFMRVVPNFVIQGGDPRNDQNGGPGYSIRDEMNLQKYTRGALGMALSGPDTGGSQFFITHSPQPHLDGGYTIFGRVYSGMNGVVDVTERGDRVETIAIDEETSVSAADLVDVQKIQLPASSPLIRPSGTFSPQAGRRATVAPRPAQRGEGGRRPGEGFIYYRGDQKLGRIVERPTSLFEDDLLAIAAKPQS
jgi:cyclophilin family peptidyl-prolyl cis-trans isomerase